MHSLATGLLSGGFSSSPYRRSPRDRASPRCTARKAPTPLRGFATWLDYAVATLDLRQAELELIWEGSDPHDCSREAIRQAVLAEYSALRAGKGNAAPGRT